MEPQTEQVQSKTELLYDLDDRVPTGKAAVYGFQHLIYFLATCAIMPVMIGAYLGLDQAEIAQMLQRTFFLSGGVSVLQCLLGHRYPIIDGPAGLWMGLLIVLSTTCTSFGDDLSVMRTSLELGMILAGCMVLIIAVTGAIDKILKVFTPVINGTFMILMVMQMSASVLKGATGLASGYTTIQPKFVLVFLVTACIILVFNMKAKGFLQSIATLIGVMCGWALAWAVGISRDFIAAGDGIVEIPMPFAWGAPTVDISVILTCLIGQFVLFSNFITTLNVIANLLDRENTQKQIRRSTIGFGLTAMLCGIFPVTGFVPFTASSVSIKLTRVAARGPFVIGGLLMMLLGIITPICTFFAAIPPAVGYAAMMVLFAMIFVQGVREYQKVELTSREEFIIGISFIVGAGVMFMDSSAFLTFPQMLRYIVSNGLIVGLILALLMEHVILRKK